MSTETSASLTVEFESNIRKTTDELLTLAAQSGDGSAFVELSQRHSRRIHRQLYRILGNWEDAEDVLQESLLKAFKNLTQFRGTSSFSTWLTRIAINSALMALRKRRAHSETSYGTLATSTGILESWEFPDLSPSPEGLCVRGETKELLRRAISRLPGRVQTVAKLHHAEECSTREISQALGISIAATKSRLFRARMMLRATLPKRGF
jgi:RNA polymerase sigma-70 factor, ECF subfamily